MGSEIANLRELGKECLLPIRCSTKADPPRFPSANCVNSEHQWRKDLLQRSARWTETSTVPVNTETSPSRGAPWCPGLA